MKSFKGRKLGGGGAAGAGSAPDTLFSEDHVEAVLGISEGPIRGIYNSDTRNFFVGETPLKNADGEKNFKRFQFQNFKGGPAGQDIPLRMGGQSSSVNANSDLAYNTPVIRQGQSNNIDYLEVRMVIRRLYQETDEGLSPYTVRFKVEHKPASSTEWQPSFVIEDFFDGQIIEDTTELFTEESVASGWWSYGSQLLEVHAQSGMPPIPQALHDPEPSSGSNPFYEIVEEDTNHAGWSHTWTPDDPDAVYDPKVTLIKDSFFWFDVDDADAAFQPYWLEYNGVAPDGFSYQYAWQKIPSAAHESFVLQDQNDNDVTVHKWTWTSSYPSRYTGFLDQYLAGNYDALSHDRRAWLNVPDEAIYEIEPTQGDVIVTSSGTTLFFNGNSWVEGVNTYDAIRGGGTREAEPGVVRIDGKTSSPYVKEFRIKVDPINEPYELRITKLTDDSNSKHYAELTWESFQEITSGVLNFPDLACTRIYGQSTDQFNNIPDFWGVYDGRIVKVPTNYDPDTRTYSGVWDGTWKMAWSNNPAYVVKDLVENDRYGLASVAPVVLNQMDVYEAGVWCDQPVPYNDDGDTRPRFTFNMLIAEQQPCIELINYVCGTFGARYFDDGNGFARIKIDDDRPAVALFTAENTAEGHFTFSQTELTSRYNDINVAFINPELNWEEDHRRVKDDADLEANGRIPLDFIAVGCTNEFEAMSRARYKLLTGLTETTMVTFRTNRQGLYLEPYDIILIADEEVDQGISGRVLEKIDANSFTVRDPVYLEAGFSYTLHIMTVVNGQPTTKELTIDSWNIGQTRTEIRVQENLGNIPDNAVWSIETQGTEQTPMPFRVLTIEQMEDDPDNVVISAIQVNRTKWYDVDNGPTSSALPGQGTRPLRQVSGLQVVPRRYNIGRQKKIALSVHWDAHPNSRVRRYSVWYQYQAGTWQDMGIVYEPQFEILDADPGIHTFRVSAIHTDGRRSPPVFVEHTIGTDFGPLRRVRNLQLVGEPNGDENKFQSPSPRFSWDHPDEEFINSYQVRVLEPNGTEIRIDETVFDTEWVYDYWMNVADGGGSPRRDFIVEVKARDFGGRLSARRRIHVNNPLPEAPSNVEAQIQGNMLIVNTPSIPLGDFRGVRIHASETDGFTPDNSNEIYKGPNNNHAYELPNAGTWYVRAAYYDIFDDEGLNYAAQVEVQADELSVVDHDPPGDITNFTAFAGPLRIILNWTNPSDEDLMFVEIFRHTVANRAHSVGIGNSSGEVFVDSEVEIGTVYYYWARAVDTSGNRGNFVGPINSSTDTVNGGVLEPGSVAGDKLRDGTIMAQQLAANAVDREQIVANAIDNARIAANAVGEEHIQELAIAANKLQDAAVERRAIVSGAIDSSRIAAAAVQSQNIAQEAVVRDAIAQQAIDTTKIAAEAIAEAQIQDSAVSRRTVALAAIDAARIAANAISESHVQDLAISASKVQDAAINRDKILDAAIDSAKLDAAAVTREKIVNAAIDASKLAANAVGSDHIENLAINADKIADLAITIEKLADNVIDSSKLAEDAVGESHIQNLAINEQKLADLAVTLNKIADGAVDSNKLAVNAVGETHIQDLAINEQKLADLAVTLNKLDDNAVDSSKLQGDAVGQTHLKNLAVTRQKLANLAVDSSKLAAAAVTREKLIDEAIDAAKLAPNAVTTSKIAAGAVAAGQLAANAVGESHLQDLAISANKIQNAAIERDKILSGAIDLDKLARGAANADAAIFTFDGDGFARGTTDDAQLTFDTDSFSGANAGFITSVLSNPGSGGATDCFSIEVPAYLALKFAGRRIRISGYAKQKAEALDLWGDQAGDLALWGDQAGDLWRWGDQAHPESAVEFAVAYSTNSDGNSGWHYFHPTTKWQQFTFTYDVPETTTSNSDWLGFWGDTSGSGKGILFDQWQIEIVPDKDELDPLETHNIKDLAIAREKLVDDAIDSAKLAAEAVDEPAIAASAVTAVKVAAGAIETEKLAAGAIVADKIAADAITTNALIAGAVVTDKIASRAITADKIEVGAIVAELMAANSIVAEAISAGAITTDKIDAGAITTQKIAAGAITATELAADSVLAENIAANAVEAASIAAGAVTADKIAANAIEAVHITSGAIETDHIASDTITADKLIISDFSNLIPNASLKDTAGWGLNHAVVHGSSDEVHTGRNSYGYFYYPYQNLSSTWTLVAYSKRFPVEAGREYYLGFQAKSDGYADVIVRLQRFDVDGNNLGAINAMQPSISNAQFETFESLATMSADTREVELRVYYHETNSAGDLTFAAPVARRATSGELIVDGAITADKIAANTITSNEIAANTITALQIASETITTNEIAVGAITTNLIEANAITANELAVDSVTTNAIAAGAITTEKLAAGAVTADKILAGTITTNEIASDTITSNNIAAGAITASEIAAGAVTTDKLEADAVTALQIAANTITAAEIEAGTITSVEIATGTITANEIAANTIQAANIAAETITAAEIATGTITANELSVDSVTADQILSGAVNTEHLAANAVTANEINAGAITTDKIDTEAITSQKIAAGAITTDKIDAGAITAEKLVIADFSNLVPNASLRDDSGWGHSSHASVLRDENNYGSRNSIGYFYYTYQNEVGAWRPLCRSARFPVERDSPYFVSAQMAIANGSSAKFWLRLDFVDANGASVGHSFPSIQLDAFNSTTLETFSFVTTPPSDAREAEFIVYYSEIDSDADLIVTSPIVRRATSGELIVDGAITANKIQAGEIKSIHLESESVTADAIKGGEISADKLAAGVLDNAGSANWLSNSDFTFGVDIYWGRRGDNGGSWTVTHDTGSYAPGGAAKIWTSAGSSYYYDLEHQTMSTDSDVPNTSQFPVEPNKRYQLSCYAAQHRLNEARLYIHWLTASGSTISFSYESFVPDFASGSGGILEQYSRHGLYATAPSNAAFARVFVRHGGTASGHSDSILWVTRVFFGEASESQVEFTPWSPSGSTVISGGMIATNTILGDKIVSGEIDTNHLAAGAITAEKLSVGVGSNQLYNSDFTLPVETNWGFGYTTGGGWNATKRTDGYAPVGGCVQITRPHSGIQVAHYQQQDLEGNDRKIPVTPGQRYQLSGYFAAHRCDASLHIRFEDENGNTVSNSTSGVFTPNWHNGTNRFAGYSRHGFYATAPSGASQAVISFKHEGTKSGSNSYLWAYRIFFGEAGPEQTEFTPWSPAGATEISGGHIKTHAIEAVHINGAQIMGEHIVGGEIDTEHLAAGSVDTDQLNSGAVTADKIAANAITVKNLVVSDWSNMVPNGALVGDPPDGWELFTTTEFNKNEWAYQNRASIGLFYWDNNNQSGWQRIASCDRFAVQGDQDFYFAFQYRVVQAHNGTGRVIGRVAWYDTDGNVHSYDNIFNQDATNTSFSWAETIITAPNGAVEAKVEFFADGGTGYGADVVIAAPVCRRATNGSLIVDGSITSDKIFSNSIQAHHIDGRIIDADHIIFGSIDGTHIASDSINADHIDVGTIDATHIEADSIDVEHIRNDAVREAQIRNNEVSENKLQGNSVSTPKIQDEAVTIGAYYRNTNDTALNPGVERNCVWGGVVSDGGYMIVLVTVLLDGWTSGLYDATFNGTARIYRGSSPQQVFNWRYQPVENGSTNHTRARATMSFMFRANAGTGWHQWNFKMQCTNQSNYWGSNYIDCSEATMVLLNVKK